MNLAYLASIDSAGASSILALIANTSFQYEHPEFLTETANAQPRDHH
ncbi:MAG: hypothetical protein ABL984_04935 [Pyrinomonadaceae bacterium]